MTGMRMSAAIGLMQLPDIRTKRASLAYGVVTRGTADTAVTLGMAYAYQPGRPSSDGSGVLVMGGEKRIARSMTFVTENYLSLRDSSVSGAIRVRGERKSFDIGVIMPLGAPSVTVTPVINVVWTL